MFPRATNYYYFFCSSRIACQPFPMGTTREQKKGKWRDNHSYPKALCHGLPNIFASTIMGWVQVDERGGALNLLWWRLFSYRNQSIDLQSKSMDLFLYDRNLHHEIVKYLICFSKEIKLPLVSIIFSFWLRQISSQAKRGFRTLSNIYDKTLYDGRFEKIIMTGSWIPLCTR